MGKSKQVWAVGETVKVGFLTLRITGTEPKCGWNNQTGYLLTDATGAKSYRFTPHEGLERLQ